MMILGTPFEYLIFALAIASISITVSKSSLFKNFRNRQTLAFVKKLVKCPYCLAHWLVVPFAWKFGFVGMFAVAGLSAIFSLPILVYLEMSDEKVHDTKSSSL